MNEKFTLNLWKRLKLEKTEEIKDMTPKLIGKTWRKYPTEKSAQLATYGLYECQYCKNTFEAIFNNVKRGNTKSCGCFATKLNITHGISQNKFYQTWYGMLQRCTNSIREDYKYYGARGVVVCEEWLDVRNFVAWSESTYPNIEGYTLDRINNDKGYSPENCRWVDRATQGLNQRMKKNNTSGYVGICWNNKNNNWMAKIKSGDLYIYIGSFHAKEEAVLARDNYIVENKLPHKLSTDYMKDK